MTTSTTYIGDRRRQALERVSTLRRHPASHSVRRGPPPAMFYVIALVVGAFVMLGLVMVLSASSISELQSGRSPWRLFNRQLLWAALGTSGLVVAHRVALRRWRRLVGPFLCVGYALMCLPLVPGLGSRVNSATEWVVIGSFSFQPSEFLKLAIILYCAHLFAKRRMEMSNLRRTMLPPFGVACAGAGLCLLQGDFGSAMVLVAIVFVMAFIAGAPLPPMAAAGAAAAAAGFAFAMSSQRRANRFTAFLDVVGNRDHLSYQTWQAMIAIAQGGATGQGPGRGTALLGGYLPLAQSDFIFAVIAQDFGLIGAVAVVGGFAVLTYAGVQVALASNDHFAALVAGGIVGWFMVQTAINVGGVTGLMPVTGLTLPFFSAGGSSLFASMVAAGLLLNVARAIPGIARAGAGSTGRRARPSAPTPLPHRMSRS